MEKKNIESILAICIGLLVLYIISHIKAFLTASIIIGLIGLLSDFLSDKIAWLWNKLAQIVGIINGKILLSLIFFLILLPVSLIMRLFGKTPIQLKKSKDSLFIERNHTYRAEEMEDIW
jgi:hypothetical protein